MSAHFIDTNIAIYAIGDDRKGELSRQVLATGPLISVQTLNEFLNVGRRKLRLEWDVLNEATADLLLLCPIVLPLTVDTHLKSRVIARRYQLATYDAVAIATALMAECNTFFSEDMQHDLIVEDRLKIINPFIERPQ